MRQSRMPPDRPLGGAVVSAVAEAGLVRTACGREFVVGHLRIDRIPRPAARVTLATERQPQDRGSLWASLTPAEARLLADFLLTHAAAAERTPRAQPAGKESPRQGKRAEGPVLAVTTGPTADDTPGGMLKE